MKPRYRLNDHVRVKALRVSSLSREIWPLYSFASWDVQPLVCVTGVGLLILVKPWVFWVFFDVIQMIT